MRALRWTAVTFGAAALLIGAVPAHADPSATVTSGSSGSSSSTGSITPAAPSATSSSTSTGGTTTSPACTPATSNSAQNPVLCIPAGFNEDKPATVPAGEGVTFVGKITNAGAAVDNATVTIALPPQLLIDPDEDEIARVPWSQLTAYANGDTDGTPLECAYGERAVTCATGSIASGADFAVAIDIEVSEDAEPGTTAPFTVTLSPSGTQPSDVYAPTTVTATIDVPPASDLRLSLSPKSARVIIGDTASLTARIRNASPTAAPGVVLFAITGPKDPRSDDAHFAITNAPENLDPDPGDGDSGGGSSSGSGSSSSSPAGAVLDGGAEALAVDLAHPDRTHVVSARTFTAAIKALTAKPTKSTKPAKTQPPTLGVWPVGTLAAGATTTITIKVKAVTVGAAQLTAVAENDGTDDTCLDSGSLSDCPFVGVASLTAVTAPPAPNSVHHAAHSPASVHHASVGAEGGGSLANSGAKDLPETIFTGLLLLVGGGMLLAIGRRVRPARHRR